MENNERNFQNGVNDVEQSKNRSKKNGKGATKFLVTIVVIFALIAGILIGVLIVKDGNVQIVNKNNESEKTVSKNENEGKSDEKEESKEVAHEKDYSKYLGMWSNNGGNFEVKNVNGKQITFTWSLYRLTGVDDVTLEFVDGKAEFYYEGYNDSNYDGKYTDDEKFMRKATIELNDDSIVAVVKEVSSIDKSAKLLEFGGSVYLEPGSYVYKRGSETVEKDKQVQNTSNEKDTAVAEIKKCLKDENWLKQNIYITEDEMIGDDDTNISDQQINFIVCKSDKQPIIIVETSSDNARFVKIDLVTYENNNVKVERINQGHIYHGGYTVDANKCVVCTSFMHQGDNATVLHSIVNGEIKVLGSYSYREDFNVNDGNTGEGEWTYKYFIDNGTNQGPDKEVSEEEFKNYKKSLNVEQYNFVSINTELTSENIDLYVK